MTSHDQRKIREELIAGLQKLGHRLDVRRRIARGGAAPRYPVSRSFSRHARSGDGDDDQT